MTGRAPAASPEPPEREGRCRKPTGRGDRRRIPSRQSAEEPDQPRRGGGDQQLVAGGLPVARQFDAHRRHCLRPLAPGHLAEQVRHRVAVLDDRRLGGAPAPRTRSRIGWAPRRFAAQVGRVLIDSTSPSSQVT